MSSTFIELLIYIDKKLLIQSLFFILTNSLGIVPVFGKINLFGNNRIFDRCVNILLAMIVHPYENLVVLIHWITYHKKNI